jgi:hypothetical protein
MFARGRWRRRAAVETGSLADNRLGNMYSDIVGEVDIDV